MTGYGLLRPALFALDAERAHRLTIRALALSAGGTAPLVRAVPRVRPVTIAGLEFPNPIGLAAGMDKDGEAITGLFGLGFGAVEIGSLTPRPQPGNPRPRLFRLTTDRAVVNRMGFNNGGIDAALERVQRAKCVRKPGGVLGINVGANKNSDDRVADYALGVGKAALHADYVTINVSSPNTPGLRDLQSRPALDELLAASSVARTVEARRVPLFLKVAPDLDSKGLDDAVRAAIDNGIDALIVGNTTISRPATLRSPLAGEAGGLSGAPLKALARIKLAEALASAGRQLPVIAVGGIDSPEEALARLEAGAALVQLYSALVYEGPGLVRRILKQL